MMKQALVYWQPSPNITYRQYYAFVDEFYKQLDFRNQITKMIIKTNNKKQKLMQKLRSEGYKHRNRDGSYTMILWKSIGVFY